jgi:hypothetical protein
LDRGDFSRANRLSLNSELIASIFGIALRILACGIRLPARVVIVDQARPREAWLAPNWSHQGAKPILLSHTGPYQKVSGSGNYSNGHHRQPLALATGPFQCTLPETDGELQWITVTVYSALDPSDPLYFLESYKGAR